MAGQVRYVTTPDGVRIAYSVNGEGTPYVFVPGWISNLEIDNQMLGGLGVFDAYEGIMRVTLDKRGTGLSSRNLDDYSLDARIMDIEAVIEDLGLDTFALGGLSEGGPIAIAFAARHPDMVPRLVISGSYANGAGLAGSKDIQDGVFTILKAEWGLASKLLSELFIGEGESFMTPEAFGAYQRSGANAEDAYKILRAAADIDVRPLLPAIKCPTLVVHNRDDRVVPFEFAQEVAAGIKGARFVSLKGGHIPPLDAILEGSKIIADFIRESQPVQHPAPTSSDGGFRAILFTDLVGHTEMMHRLGDARGRAVLREHEQVTRDVLKAHNGSEVKTMGDGFMAAFTSVTKAVECGIDLQRAFAKRSSDEPLHVRVGLNAGEPIQEDGDLFGETVILAARIAAKAEGGEILVADTVRGLCSGKGFLFADRGEFVAKGFEDPVRVYQVSWR
ncbi:MAG TPA: adenylate/guanylate cyclase domain-containing protein [Dehalococcoidia bacterium]|nr:adenylate/guanylate cyclase domain-containing protein [Dehalococcoidia bacterium]